MGAYRGRPGTGRSSSRNLPGCGGVDVVALAAAGMAGHRTVLEAEPAGMWRRRRGGAGGGRDDRTSQLDVETSAGQPGVATEQQRQPG